jgi:hypothetical protein
VTQVLDTFTRADATSPLGTADSGQTWTAAVGTWGISSNQAYTSAANSSGSQGALAVVDAGTADCTITLDVNNVSVSNTQGGIVFRYVDNSNFWCFIRYDNGGTQQWYLDRIVGGSSTAVATANAGSGTTDTLQVLLSGSSIVCKLNGTTVTTQTDSTFVTATKHGLNIYNSTGVRLDNFSLTGVGRATEADAARPIAMLIAQTIAVGRASETDAARAATPVAIVSVGRAAETDAARAVAIVQSRTYQIQTVSHGPTVNGPFGITQPDVFVPELTVTLHERAAPLALVGELENSFSRQFKDDANDAGSAQLTLDGEDPDVADVTEEKIVRFNVRGVPAFDALLEQVAQATLAQGEEHDQVSAYQGRGKICVLEEGLVYPSLGLGVTPVEDDRTFDWTWNAYDDSAWGPASVMCDVAFAQANWPALGLPRFADGWVNTAELVIWSDDGTYINALPPSGLTGPDSLSTNYFRHVFDAPTYGTYRISTVFDNYGEFYIDGVRPPPTIVSSGDGFTHMQSADVIMSAGAHIFSAKVSNLSAPLGDTNPGALVYDISPLQPDNTVTPGTSVDSSGPWVSILQRQTTAPGVSVGLVIRTLIYEAKFRGCIPEVTLGFDDFTDSNGRPWAVTSLISTKVGTDLLTFLKELSGTYIDFWMPPGDFVLMACTKGQRGTTRDVTIGGPSDPDVPRSGNATTLTHKRTV